VTEPTIILPGVLKEEVDDIETRVAALRGQRKRDSWRFWTLKVLGMAFSTGSGLSALFVTPVLAAVFGFAGGVFVLIDSTMPLGRMYNATRSAISQLESVRDGIRTDWKVGSLNEEAPKPLMARIVKEAAAKRMSILAALDQAAKLLNEK
jgi:hypothetical protein